ncbi:MAG TPA: sugar phosphate isomerase/epimerase family protein [bacterium]|mgnify:CR=1 FL=1|nr:sugar phosphate isomerase/epimerase family protein [bacterium]HOL49213.1 sugar phosphate isomerase/epimerase family protein [bacterium]HPO51583.1 sugar phosphate isomerase/epimerase family protein [bacterium]
MKFAFMSFSCPEADLYKMLDYARKYGYDGVEPRAQAQHNHGIEIEASKEKRKEIKKFFDESGIECSCIATSIRYCFTDAQKRKESIGMTRAFIDLACDIGVKRIRVFGGVPDKEISVDEAIKIVGECLGIAGEYAEKNRVFICLETHDFFSRADTVAKAVKVAGSPNVKINWDIMHPYTQGMTIKEAFDIVKEFVEHCHIHDGIYDQDRKVTLALMGQGEIPYKTALRLLQEINYQGFFSGEYINAWEPDVVLPHDIKVLKSYLL